MTDKPPPDARAWDQVQRLLAEAEAEELASVPIDQLRDELVQAGLEPDSGLAALAAARAQVDVESAAKAQTQGTQDAKATRPTQADKPAPVVDLAAARQRRRIAPVTIVIAIAAAAALVLGLAKRDELVAYFSPAPTTPQPTPTITPPPLPTTPAPPTEQQLAETLRDRAYDDCKKGYMGECADEANAAQSLQPGGPDDARWRETLSAVNDWVINGATERERLAKRGLAPGERKLQRVVRH